MFTVYIQIASLQTSCQDFCVSVMSQLSATPQTPPTWPQLCGISFLKGTYFKSALVLIVSPSDSQPSLLGLSHQPIVAVHLSQKPWLNRMEELMFFDELLICWFITTVNMPTRFEKKKIVSSLNEQLLK